MLFNSYEFIFVFLPITLVLYYVLGSRLPRVAILLLVIASLVFYAYWDVRYLPLLIFSIAANYIFGVIIEKNSSKTFLILGIILNFLLLIYFKYTIFITTNLNVLLNAGVKIPEIVLPLGISFFTFTQTAFLIDSYRGETKHYDLGTYCLFVTIFPHLIAGPILHHKEMIPQFLNPRTFRINWKNIWLGVIIFIVGLSKKCLIADNLAVFANPIFNLSANGPELALIESWVGALAYTMQLYFDFSGYSEMAIGLALMLNIRIPVNFFSPYKASSIIDFWRRWHISLSNYLRDYLYIPLGGNKLGEGRRILNLLITMLLGGLWHGAGWNFIIWGGLHGVYLTVNHAWRVVVKKIVLSNILLEKTVHFMAHFITFLSVVIAWVFFRADSVETALRVCRGMFGVNGISVRQDIAIKLKSINWLSISSDGFLPVSNLPVGKAVVFIVISLIIVFKLPNIFELLSKHNPALGLNSFVHATGDGQHRICLLQPKWAVVLGVLAGLSILGFSKVSEFLYFQF